jgi:hypothetical protein
MARGLLFRPLSAGPCGLWICYKYAVERKARGHSYRALSKYNVLAPCLHSH